MENRWTVGVHFSPLLMRREVGTGKRVSGCIDTIPTCECSSSTFLDSSVTLNCNKLCIGVLHTLTNCHCDAEKRGTRIPCRITDPSTSTSRYLVRNAYTVTVVCIATKLFNSMRKIPYINLLQIPFKWTHYYNQDGWSAYLTNSLFDKQFTIMVEIKI